MSKLLLLTQFCRYINKWMSKWINNLNVIADCQIQILLWKCANLQQNVQCLFEQKVNNSIIIPSNPIANPQHRRQTKNTPTPPHHDTPKTAIMLTIMPKMLTANAATKSTLQWLPKATTTPTPKTATTTRQGEYRQRQYQWH